MKRKDDTLAIVFVTVLTVIIWIWSATRTEDTRNISTTLHFKAPEGSSVTITPESKPVRLTFKGPRASIDTVEELCANGLHIPISLEDGDATINATTTVNAIDAVRISGAVVITSDPSTFTIHVQSLVTVEASVQFSLPSVQVSGDVTVDPSTVLLQIPTEIRNSMPESITVTAVVDDNVLAKLEPGIIHTQSAAITLPDYLENKGILVEPNRVSLSFKIQSKTGKTTLPQVRVLIAAPAEDYSEYAVSLPVKIIPNVSIEADNELIANIASGDVTVYAIVRLASRDMEQQITSKLVTSFVAMLEDGTGVQVQATVEDISVLDVALAITPVVAPTP